MFEKYYTHGILNLEINEPVIIDEVVNRESLYFEPDIVPNPWRVEMCDNTWFTAPRLRGDPCYTLKHLLVPFLGWDGGVNGLKNTEKERETNTETNLQSNSALHHGFSVFPGCEQNYNGCRVTVDARGIFLEGLLQNLGVI